MLYSTQAGRASRPFSTRLAIAGIGVFALTISSWASAAWVGMVSDNGGKSVQVFDAGTDTISEFIAAAPGMAQGDCAISADQRVGITTNSSSLLSFVDLENPARNLIENPRQVHISNLGVDMALSPDSRFLVSAGGGALGQPLSVVDLDSRSEIAAVELFTDHSSVEFCDDGTLLVTSTHGEYYGSPNGSALFDATLGKDGQVTLLGHSVSANAVPNNSVCAPGSRAGVMLDRDGGITSFTLPGLDIAQHLEVSSREVISASFSRDGRRLFVRTVDSVMALAFDRINGHMQLVWQRPAPLSSPYFGMDQIAAHPAEDKVYVDGGDVLLILDANSGEATGSITAGDATGVCFASTAFEEAPALADVLGSSGIPVAPPP